MSKLLVTLAGLAAASPAAALQPLETFLRGARTDATELGEARAARRQARAESDAALGTALPGLSLRGTYTRNEHETTLPAGPGGAPVTLTPRERLDGAATLEVPLVDLSRFARIRAARTGARAAAREEAATALEVESLVSRDWHALVADLALVAASRRALEVARSTLRTAERRHEAGAVTRLDVERARAEVERNVQQVAGAELRVALDARALESRTGIAPEPGEAPRLEDDLREAPALEALQVPDAALPAVEAAAARRRQAEQDARARRLALLPSLDATLTQYATDAEGLAGREAWLEGVVGLTWRLDLGTLADVRARQAAADGARSRERRARLAARDAIHAAWETVRTEVARARSARAQAEVAGRAAALALERYDAGEATQLDLLQAQRDAFAADAARIDADAALADARAQLRIATGRSLLADPAHPTDGRETP
jgi:outer membrane protein TolC